MRKIIFRAWHKLEKEMLEVRYFDFASNLIYLQNQSSNFNSQLEDCELMQFIGLLDKNGNHIFEGDIVTFEVENSSMWVGSKKGVITFNDDTCAFGISLKIGKFVSINWGYDAYGSTIEVLGNLYEHPELLEQK
jgi:uncharacterized phage protein (TIGR01671 family)